MATPFQLFIETGGTFTDALAITPEGEVRRAKVLSSGRLRVGVLGRYGLPGIGEVVVVSCLGLDSAAGMVGAVVRRLTADGGESEEVGEVLAAGEVLEGGVFDLVLGKASPRVLEGLTEGAVLEVDFGLDAPAVAAHLLTRTGLREALPAIALRLATTRGTNALLTRSFAPVALFVTKGFADLLEIGTQARPDIFAINIKKPVALHAMTVEVSERLDARGRVLLALDEVALLEAARGALKKGIVSAAVVFAHSDLYGEHERMAGRILREAGFEFVSVSHELSAQVGFLKRAQTTVANAALLPVISKYLGGAAAGRAGGGTLVMASSGGLIESGAIHPKDMLFSGPASGVIGAAWAAGESGFARTISFDMGGTSTDVSRRDATGGKGSGLEYVFEHQVRGSGGVGGAGAEIS